jgi:hypothetical protein
MAQQDRAVDKAPPPARTPREAAERLKAAGHRIKKPTRQSLPPPVDLPPLTPHLQGEHGDAR